MFGKVNKKLENGNIYMHDTMAVLGRHTHAPDQRHESITNKIEEMAHAQIDLRFAHTSTWVVTACLHTTNLRTQKR